MFIYEIFCGFLILFNVRGADISLAFIYFLYIAIMENPILYQGTKL